MTDNTDKIQMTQAAVQALSFPEWLRLDPERMQLYLGITEDEAGDKVRVDLFEAYGLDLSEMVKALEEVAAYA